MTTLLLVGAAFLAGGTIKGMLGLGLPPVAMGLMVLVMTPVQAAAILVLPTVLTNIWQMLDGGNVGALARRLWPFLVCLVIGVFLGRGWLSDDNAAINTAALGVIIVIYGLLGLRELVLSVSRRVERWASAPAGLLSGMAMAATGIAFFPLVPYLQGLELTRDRLVQALGLVFTTMSVAFGVMLASKGQLTLDVAPHAITAFAATVLGVYLGRRVRKRLPEERFRTALFIGSVVFGASLIVKAVWG
ncbi:MAG: sulfite exporter TauE/SafE family protein [Pseudomonadota bacterium]